MWSLKTDGLFIEVVTQAGLTVHTYIHTYIHSYICTYIHTYKHTYIHTYIHIFFVTKLLMFPLLFLQVLCGKCNNGLGHEFLGDGPNEGQSRF